MEETRSFGYVCPKCGTAVVARRSKFALSAAAVRMECPKCGESALEVQTDGESVYDVLQRVCKANKIHMESSFTPVYNSAYIEGIHNLYEFDVGKLSG